MGDPAPNIKQFSDQELREEIQRIGLSRAGKPTLSERLYFGLLLSDVYRREKPEMEMSGYVYLMHDCDNRYKIGLSINPLRRRDELDETLTIVCQIETGDMYGLESALHGVFLSKRINHRGGKEWFALEPADVDFIKSLVGGAS